MHNKLKSRTHTHALVLWTESTGRTTFDARRRTQCRQRRTTVGDAAAAVSHRNVVVVLIVVVEQSLTAEWFLALAALQLFIGARRLFRNSGGLCQPDWRRVVSRRQRRWSGSWCQFCDRYCLGARSLIDCSNRRTDSVTVQCFCDSFYGSSCHDDRWHVTSNGRRQISCFTRYLDWHCCHTRASK